MPRTATLYARSNRRENLDRQVRERPCRLDAGPLAGVAGWVDHYRRFWDASFDRLDEHLREIQRGPAGSARAG
ncbi:MAG: hypothetical protein M3Y48_07840 [Actinomycetota bacterium]|nr:hypothetical protein [Actinomycetota bacterium]